jgi:hypothetical protein
MTNTGLVGRGEAGLALNARGTDPVPECFSTAQWCLHVCYPVLAKHIARADARLHATNCDVLLRLCSELRQQTWYQETYAGYSGITVLV